MIRDILQRRRPTIETVISRVLDGIESGGKKANVERNEFDVTAYFVGDNLIRIDLKSTKK